MSSSTGRTMQGNDDLKALAAQEVLTVWTAALFASTIAAMPGTGWGIVPLAGVGGRDGHVRCILWRSLSAISAGSVSTAARCDPAW
jgi:hypothetical protein